MAFLTEAANRGSIATGYEIENSLKLEADNAEYLYYTPSTQTDYERMAFSIWVKRTELGSGNLAEFGNGTANTSNLRIGFDSSDRLFCYGNSIIWRQTNQVFRDTSAWYHLFFLFDTTTPGGISNNRIRIWVNGEMIAHTDFGVINNPGSGAAMGFNNALQQSIGAQREGGPTNYFKGYIAQAYGSGGTPPVVTDFGEFDSSGIWKPIDISELTPPDTAGFNLDFSDASNLGNDISTRNNNFTLQNITSADQATDTPTNNFCTMAGLWEYSGGNRVGVDGGTTTNATNGGYAWQGGKGTMGVTNGKWYFEFTVDGGPSGFHSSFMVGWQTENMVGATASAHNIIGTIAYYGEGGGFIWVKDNTSGRTLSVTGSTTYGDIYGVALDLDSNPQTVIFYRNGSAITSNITLGSGLANETLFPFESTYYPQEISRWNFGGYTAMSIASGNTDANGYGNFEYAPPSGYYALCSKNLARFG